MCCIAANPSQTAWAGNAFASNWRNLWTLLVVQVWHQDLRGAEGLWALEDKATGVSDMITMQKITLHVCYRSHAFMVYYGLMKSMKATKMTLNQFMSPLESLLMGELYVKHAGADWLCEHGFFLHICSQEMWSLWMPMHLRMGSRLAKF